MSAPIHPTKTLTVSVLPADLQRLAERASQLHQEASDHATKAVRFAIQCGALLADAKSKCQHGDWMPFLEASGMNKDTASRYMAVAAAFDRDAKFLTEGKSLSDLYRELGLIKPAAGGGNRLGKAELARRNGAGQLQFHYIMFETAFKEIGHFVEAKQNPFELLERTQLPTVREELVKALALVDAALAN